MIRYNDDLWGLCVFAGRFSTASPVQRRTYHMAIIDGGD